MRIHSTVVGLALFLSMLSFVPVKAQLIADDGDTSQSSPYSSFSEITPDLQVTPYNGPNSNNPPQNNEYPGYYNNYLGGYPSYYNGYPGGYVNGYQNYNNQYQNRNSPYVPNNANYLHPQNQYNGQYQGQSAHPGEGAYGGEGDEHRGEGGGRGR